MTTSGDLRVLGTITLMFIMVLLCPFAYGKVIYVDNDATGSNDGTSWANAYIYLQDAMADANTAEKPIEIRVAQGIYRPDQGVNQTPGDREATSQLINGVTLKGGYAGINEPDPNARDVSLYETILSGDLNSDDIGWNELMDISALQESWLIEPNREDNTYHVVIGSGTDETAVLDGFTIAGGCTTYFEDSGGGMYNHAGSPTVTNCIFKRNSARWDGGGMSSEGNSNPILSNCTFTRNCAFHGGGMYNKNSNPTLTNCAFTDNLTVVPPAIIEHNYRAGSGIYNNRSSPTLTNCTFRGNSADRGGGMYNYQSHSILTNCTFSKNLAGYGAGIYNSESNPALNNCIFSGNFANYGSGGGISWGSPALTNCTFTGNEAEAGGGISGGSPILTNCIVWGNTPPQILADATISYSNVQGSWPGEGNIDADPFFIDANGDDDVFGTEDDDLRLLLGSPCIDAGDNSALLPSMVTDITGKPRIINDVIDMGAYESPLSELQLSKWFVIVPEGETAVFTIALAEAPSNAIEVNTAFFSGDQDITVESGGILTFNASNYSVPQIVTLSAAQDNDNQNSITQILIITDNGLTGVVTATEADNEPDVGVLFVDDDAIGNNNGANWTDAYIHLQDALSAAAVSSGIEEIRVAQGIYRPDRGGDNIPGDRSATFQLVLGVAIKGGFAGTNEIEPDARDVEIYKTVLSGDLNSDDIEVADPHKLWDESTRSDNCYHVVTCTGIDETTIIDGFTITGGNNNIDPHYYGGGVYNRYGRPVIANCIFTKNSALFGGGGMYNVSSNPTITNCIFTINYAHRYGGAMDNSSSNPIITNCTFHNNYAYHYGGGGMSNWNSNPVLTDCTFTENSADGYFTEGGGMYNKASNPTLTNCTFTGNSAINGYSAQGGAIFNDSDVYLIGYSPSFIGSNPILTDCIFTDNLAQEGAGIYNSYSAPTLTDCTFSGNISNSGGGVYNNKSNPSLTNCIFNVNAADADDGGGMYNYHCSPILFNCTFIDNSASGNGGGMHNKTSSPTLTHCIFSRNLANNGGGLHNLDSSSPILTNCIFNGNSANNGGGLYNIYGNHSLTNCTFSENVANSGGGLYNGGGTLTFTNCILWGNSDNNGRGESGQIYGRKSVVNFCCIEGWTGTLEGVDNIGADPLFADSEDGDYHLKSETGRWDPLGGNWIKDYVTSPCIDAGNPHSPIGDEPVPNGGRINMGAYGGTAEASMSQ
ncbi:MAG: right-handed parallel beta-helix repeat-containing protein [Phycisphaerae bacterium]